MRRSTPSFTLKHRISDFFSIVTEVLRDNDDGRVTGRRGMLIGGYMTTFVNCLITGNYFTGLLLAMGADDIYISYINMATTLCGFLQFVAPLLLERMKKRKTFLMIMRFVYHFLNIAAIGLIPIIPADKIYLFAAMLITIILVNSISALCAPGYSIWHMQSLPEEKRSNYFTISNLGGTILNLVSAFVAARFVDTMDLHSVSVGSISPTVTALLILRLIAMAGAALELFSFSKIKEYPYESDTNAKNNRGLRLLLSPAGNKMFMMTISIQIIWTFACALIGKYFEIYLLDIVDMSYTYLSLSGIVSTPIIIIMTPVWAQLLRRHKWYNMLAIAIAGYSFAYVGNFLVTSSTEWMYIVVLLICYLFNPCINIMFSTITYMNMPETNRTAYLSFYSLCSTIASFLGTVCGTIFMNATYGADFTLFGLLFTNYQYLNMVQFILIIGIAAYVAIMGKRLSGEK